MRISDWSSDLCSSDLPANRSHTQDHDRQGARVMGTARNDLGRKAPESGAPDIRAGRRDAAGYAAGFAAAVPDLDQQASLVEANRCYFCYDAPCIEACPTGLDIPGFIRKIATGNTAGAALSSEERRVGKAWIRTVSSRW